MTKNGNGIKTKKILELRRHTKREGIRVEKTQKKRTY